MGAPLDPLNLVWIDLEMTGLDPERDRILEIATVVTDKDLNIVAEGPALVIHQPEEILAQMGTWCQTHHAASGLLEEVRQSRLTEREAELRTLEFLRAWVPPETSPMCGNTVCQDRRFLARYMPELERFFHYRHLDVSTIKELARRWRPGVLSGWEKRGVHRALEDIKESIEELRHYRETFFKLGA